MSDKTFKDIAAQGELTLFRIPELPGDIDPMEVTGGRFIIGHSETGHHHVIDAGPGVEVFVRRQDPLTMFLRILADEVKERKVRLRHERNFHNHAALAISPGTYQINVAREFGAAGWRRVID